METIYGIQADTETLREAHERQRRSQQRLQEQQSSITSPDSSTKIGLAKLKGPPKPTLVARSTSTSALPSPAALQEAATGGGGGTLSNASTTSAHASAAVTPSKDITTQQPNRSGSTATSPFFASTDYHIQYSNPSTGPAQLRSTTHSPAFLSKFYDVDHHHRLQSSIPWLALPGSVATTTGSSGLSSGAESPASMFGRRRSDVGLPGASSTGSSTPSLGLDKLSLDTSPSHQLQQQQQENPHPQPPQPQHHHYHHLLSHQELTALSRNNSPLPLNEALPTYLRKKGTESMHSMERSFSSPGHGVGSALGGGSAGGSGIIHTAPVSPFMLPIHPTTSFAASQTQGGGVGGGGGVMSSTHTAPPGHLSFAFPGSSVGSLSKESIRPEMERASSTGMLPMTNQRPHLHHHHHNGHHHHSHLGTFPAASTSVGNLPVATKATAGPISAGTGAGGASTPSSFFRSSKD